MYTFQKLMIDNNVILAIKVIHVNNVLINFCTVLRAMFLWRSQQLNGHLPYKYEEMETLKKIYQNSLEEICSKQGYVLVDIANGEIIDPSRISRFQIMDEYQGPLPF